MPDDFNPFDFDPYIPSKEEQLLEQITDLRYTTETQIDTIAQNQTNMLKYTKSVNDNLPRLTEGVKATRIFTACS